MLTLELIRDEYDNTNSIFYQNAKCVYDVLDIDGNKLKYIYNIPKQELTVLGNYKRVYVKLE